MFAISSEILISRFYNPEGHACWKCSQLTDKDKLIYGIPEKFGYLDLITGVVLIIIGALVAHNLIAINGAFYFIGFGIAEFTIGLIFKLLSLCCPYLGSDRWDHKSCFEQRPKHSETLGPIRESGDPLSENEVQNLKELAASYAKKHYSITTFAPTPREPTEIEVKISQRTQLHQIVEILDDPKLQNNPIGYMEAWDAKANQRGTWSADEYENIAQQFFIEYLGKIRAISQINFSTIPSLERTKIIVAEDHISELPDETILHIFGYLNLRELGSNSLVSRRWQRLSSDPYLWNALVTKTFPHLNIFGASDWAKYFDLSRYGLSVEDEPPIDNRTLIPILKQFSSLPIEKHIEENDGELIEKDAGFTLLTIPKGLTIKKLIDMAKEGDKVEFRSISDCFLRQIDAIETDKTYRILITNNILERSRGLTIEEQKDLVERTFKCERSNALPTLTLVVTTFIRSGKRLYVDNPWTFACCTLAVDEKRPVIVGGFGSAGLHIGSDGYVGILYGIAVLRKL